MSFKITARMILELGAELISSDAVALYELIKNAIDAESPSIDIHLQVVLRRSIYQDYVEALETLEEADSAPSEDDLLELRTKLIDAMDMSAPAGERRLFESTLEAAPLTASDLKAALQTAYHDRNWIMVRDRGNGMSASDLDEIFLTIGTRSRRQEKVGADGAYRAPSRTILGDKGVGRLSAMRLGDHMVVTTSKAGDNRLNVLDIDWTRFSHESSALLGDIDIKPTSGPIKPDRWAKGTTIMIRNLRGDWDAGTFQRMIDGQFKRIVDPFPSARTNETWQDPQDLFDLKFNDSRFEVPEIPSWLLGRAHAVVKAKFRIVGDKPVLEGEIDYRLRNRQTQFELNEAELISLTDPIADRLIRTGPKTLRELGPFEVEFYWYNRRILAEIPELDKRRADVITEVNHWAGGLMVFRDLFRINPYGGQDDDWLELDKKALAARGYKVNRSQIIGKVALTSENLKLVEQTNREGLADNEYKQVLVGMLRHILISEFRRFIENVDKERKLTDESTVEDIEQRIEEASTKIEAKILQLRRDVPEQEPALTELTRLTVSLTRAVDQARAMAREYEDDRSKFVHLAGIGLMVEFLLHEIGRATHRALGVMEEIDRADLNTAGSASLRTLQDQLITLSKRVDTLDPLSASRRQTKETFDLRELIDQVVDGREAQIGRHRLSVRRVLPDRPYKVKAVRGMVLQIIENLFENSVYWLKVEQRRDRTFRGEVSIVLDASANELLFSDNGPGITISRGDQVFEPFVTSKPPGQGRGLGLYISREMARYHDWSLSLVPDALNEEGRLTTFVMEMDPR